MLCAQTHHWGLATPVEMHKFCGFVPVDDPSTVRIEALSSFHLSTPLGLLFPQPGADPEPIPAAWAAGVCSSQQIRASSLPGSSGFVGKPGTENPSKAEGFPSPGSPGKSFLGLEQDLWLLRMEFLVPHPFIPWPCPAPCPSDEGSPHILLRASLLPRVQCLEPSISAGCPWCWDCPWGC